MENEILIWLENELKGQAFLPQFDPVGPQLAKNVLPQENLKMCSHSISKIVYLANGQNKY